MRYMLTRLAVAAGVTTPGALVFSISSYAQRAISVFSVRAQNVAFVQHDTHRVDVMVPVPNDCDTGFVFSLFGLI